MNDPNASADDSAKYSAFKPPFSRLDRFPATPEGHLAFLEDFAKQVHSIIPIMNGHVEYEYTDTATVEGFIRDINLKEAVARVNELPMLPGWGRTQFNEALNDINGKLTLENIELFDERLYYAVRQMRNAFDRARLAARFFIVRTVGDLRKALEEGKTPLEGVIKIAPGPPSGDHIADQFYPYVIDPNKRTSLEQVLALCDLEGGNPAEALRKLIARTALKGTALNRKVDRQQLINLTLAEFLAKVNGDTQTGVAVANPTASTKRSKRSTQKGDARLKIISALTAHHQYAKGSCLNLEPIGSNELARMADVSGSSASAFFKKKFEGLQEYKTICADASKLVIALKMLNDEFSPHVLLSPHRSHEIADDE